MGGHKHFTTRAEEKAAAPVIPSTPDYIVTGNPIPDCKGNYYYVGELNGQHYYKRSDSAYYIFRNVINTLWLIDIDLSESVPYWYRFLTGITGTYSPKWEYANYPVVSVGGH